MIRRLQEAWAPQVEFLSSVLPVASMCKQCTTERWLDCASFMDYRLQVIVEWDLPLAPIHCLGTLCALAKVIYACLDGDSCFG